jgi:hypothetical protein
MALPSEVAKSLSYLRRKYQVSERDLTGLAKKLTPKHEPEESWEEIVLRYKRNRQGRFTRLGRDGYGHPKKIR